MVKIVCISDTHNKIEDIFIPDGDILVHAGDATGRGTVKEVQAFNESLGKLPHKYILFTPGNHDFIFEQDEPLARSLLTNVTHCLIDEEVIIDGIKFYGSPWSPWFHDWAFNATRGKEIKTKWDLIPHDVDVLITHGPPHGILDGVLNRWSGAVEHVGCEELAKVIEKIEPKIHVFGHIHEGYSSTEIGNTIFINASSLDGLYKPINRPIIFSL